jgi:hypothetical protein
VHVRRIAPTSARIENDRQFADGSHLYGHLRHFGKGQIGFRYTFQPAQRSAAQIDGLKTGFLGEPRHDRIERDRSDNEIGTIDECLQSFHHEPPSELPGGRPRKVAGDDLRGQRRSKET